MPRASFPLTRVHPLGTIQVERFVGVKAMAHETSVQPNLTEFRPGVGRPVSASDLAGWVADVAHKKQYPQMLLALGTLRLANHFEAADAFIRAHDAEVPGDWRVAWDNEKAAVLWHSGR